MTSAKAYCYGSKPIKPYTSYRGGSWTLICSGSNWVWLGNEGGR